MLKTPNTRVGKRKEQSAKAQEATQQAKVTSEEVQSKTQAMLVAADKLE